MRIGFISAQYESHGKPDQIPPNTGEQSYGTFQLLGDPPARGGDPIVVKFLKRSGYYQRGFSSLTLNSAEFKEKWREFGQTDPLFAAAQYQYMAETHFYPLTNYIEKKGFPRSTAIDEALFSIAVQHGGAKKICDNATSKLDLKTATEEQVVNALYTARTEYVESLIQRHIGREDDLKAVIEKRYPQEKEAVLQLIKRGESSETSFENLFEQLGLSSQEAEIAAQEAEKHNTFNPEEMKKKLTAMLEWYKQNQIPVAELAEDTDDIDNTENTEGASSPAPIDPSSIILPPASPSREEEYKGIEGFLEFIKGIGITTGSKGLIQTASVIQHVMEAYQAINALTGSIATGAAVAGPIGALGGAVLGIINLFMSSGPSATEIILRQIDHLSEQIVNLTSYVAIQFKELFEQNQEILNALHNGLYAVTLEIDDKIGSLREELESHLEKIERAILYVAQQSHLEIKQLAFQPLRAHYTKVKSLIESKNPNLVGNAHEVIPTLMQDLVNWIVTESISSLYTGGILYQIAPPPEGSAGELKSSLEILKIVLNGEESGGNFKSDILLSSLIAYLANYYVYYRASPLIKPIKVDLIPNPRLWYDVAQKYLALVSTFPEYDNSGSYYLDNILQAGSHFIELINIIINDTAFLENLCIVYNNLKLQAAFNQFHYIQEYSASIKQLFQLVDRESPYPPIPVEWDFLMPPDRFIDRMTNRNIQQIVSFSNNLGISNLKPLLKTIDGHYFLSSNAIAAEYLGLVSFSAQKIGDIPLPSCINPIEDANFDEVNARLNERGGKRQEGDTVIGKAGMEIFRKPGTDERVTEWTLPLKLSITIRDSGEIIDAFRFDIRGSYAELQVQTGFWLQAVVVGYRPVSRGSEVPIYKFKYSIPANAPGSYGYDLMAAIPKYVKDQWEKADHFDTTNGQVLHSRPQAERIKNLVESYFLTQRKKIAALLNSETDSASEHTNGDRQKYHNAYKETLIKLDIHVRLMQLFSYLIGKDPNCSFFGTLMTSVTAHKRLKEFEGNPTLQTELYYQLPHLHKKDILSLPDLNIEEMQDHPRQLFEKISIISEKYRQSKIIFDKIHKPDTSSRSHSTLTTTNARGFYNNPVTLFGESSDRAIARSSEEVVASASNEISFGTSTTNLVSPPGNM